MTGERTLRRPCNLRGGPRRMESHIPRKASIDGGEQRMEVLHETLDARQEVPRAVALGRRLPAIGRRMGRRRAVASVQWTHKRSADAPPFHVKRRDAGPPRARCH